MVVAIFLLLALSLLSISRVAPSEISDLMICYYVLVCGLSFDGAPLPVGVLGELSHLIVLLSRRFYCVLSATSGSTERRHEETCLRGFQNSHRRWIEA